ncbi:hypothetical protein ANRL3_02047 [Anaerolineae bacterium]|nr:hypothetical protein ANRL3_02047 [Anaerolineae bacterium]
MKSRAIDLLILSTAIGLIATFSAPWVELRGTFAAWRIVEWHTFWRGENAFMLGDVVASNYQMVIEFGTAAMQATLRAMFALGSALAAWHSVAFIALLIGFARTRVGVSRSRIARDIATIVIVSALALGLLAFLLALPSSLTTKVDFRTPADIHTDSLVWSSVDILPVAPALALFAALIQVSILGIGKLRKSNGTRTRADKRR